MYYYKRDSNPECESVTLVLESPNGHREYQYGERWNMEQFIKDGYFTDRFGFKWKAWLE